MLRTYTATYTKIDSGYMGQLLEWPQVITEGASLEECRELLRDALREMILACQQLKAEPPSRHSLIEWISIELWHDEKVP